jgi:hypothetical protein
LGNLSWNLLFILTTSKTDMHRPGLTEFRKKLIFFTLNCNKLRRDLHFLF